mgnify:CR=1 FL=1|tara:strand:- start:907 stop:1800 length:894 start_codon:yes stop_codon:yes gene_type:complete
MVAKSSPIQYSQIDGESFANVPANGLTFTCRVAGMDNDGDAIILLHGFPETSHMWFELMPTLAKEGFRVIAPDQRGYSPGARPSGKNAYKMEYLIQDVLSIADAFGIEKFHLAGHDWGSAVGWALAYHSPDRVYSWTALSVPHLTAFLNAVMTDEVQKKKSEYISFFRKPILPELYFCIFGHKNLKRVWGRCSENQIEKYLGVFKQRKAIKAALHWYRANMGDDNQGIGDIKTPTLLIWGERDMAIGKKGVEDTESYMKGPYQLETLQSGHWLLQESFPDVSELILSQINRYKSSNY